MKLPFDPRKRREDGRDVVGIKISSKTVKRVINFFKKKRKPKHERRER
jgi:hypothetical protein